MKFIVLVFEDGESFSHLCEFDTAAERKAFCDGMDLVSGAYSADCFAYYHFPDDREEMVGRRSSEDWAREVAIAIKAAETAAERVSGAQ